MRSFARRRAAGFRRFLAILVIVLAVELVVQIANPFGIEDAIKSRAAQTLQLVTAPFYGGGKETPGQRVVTVVLIDPEYFRAVRPQGAKPIWPMPVDMLTMGVIRRIVDSGPKAVFVDIGFPDAPREIVDGGSNSRAEALDMLASRLSQLNPEVPVFLGDSISSSVELGEAYRACGVDFVPTSSIRAHNLIAAPLLDKLFPGPRPGAKLEVVDASWRGNPGDYQLAPATTGEGNCRGLQQENKGYIVSPALALFAAYAKHCPDSARDICSRPRFMRLAKSIEVANTPPSLDGLRTYELHGKASGEMSPRWGIGLSQNMDKFFRNADGTDACYDQFYSNSFDPLKNYLLHLFGPIERRLGKSSHRRCVYIDTISAAALLDPRRFGGAEPTTDGQQHQAIQDAFLKDRIVLLGVNLPQAGDSFASPINGAIPGVYMHAVALENLITFGDRFHTAEASFVGWLAMIVLVVILFRAMTWLWEVLCIRLSAVAPGWGMHLLAPLSYVAIMFCLGSLIILALSWTDLPLTEMAGPIITLHVIFFSGLVANWRDALLAKFAKTAEEPVM